MRKRAMAMSRRRSMRHMTLCKLPKTQHTKISLTLDTIDYFKVDWSEGAVIARPLGNNP